MAHKQIKNAIFLAIFGIAMIAFGCDKVNNNDVVDNNGILNQEDLNAKFKQTGDPYDYVFVNPKWELVDENYTDEHGNSGELYVNANNPIEKYFWVKIRVKACGDGGSSTVKGTWNTVKIYDPVTRTTTYVKTCDITMTNQTCGITVTFNEKKEICSVSVYDLNPLADPRRN